MKFRAFFDTNILAYEFDSSDIQKQEKAKEILDTWRPSGFFVISTQVIQELFVVLTRKLRPALPVNDAFEVIKAYSSCAIHTISVETILKAIRISDDHSLSFGDGLIITAAKEAGCKVLFTEDLNHGQVIWGIKIVNPFL